MISRTCCRALLWLVLIRAGGELKLRVPLTTFGSLSIKYTKPETSRRIGRWVSETLECLPRVIYTTVACQSALVRGFRFSRHHDITIGSCHQSLHHATAVHCSRLCIVVGPHHVIYWTRSPYASVQRSTSASKFATLTMPEDNLVPIGSQA